jgi:hypothetical protein
MSARNTVARPAINENTFNGDWCATALCVSRNAKRCSDHR